MKSKTVELLIGLLLVSVVCGPLAAFALSYPPAPLYHRHGAGEVIVRGGTVYLFHSGTAEVRKTISPGDILEVYRIDSLCNMTKEGRIRVVSYLGDTYLKAKVVGGQIKPNDVAKKGSVSCLVISAGMCEGSSR
jgi:hypothetical protein